MKNSLINKLNFKISQIKNFKLKLNKIENSEILEILKLLKNRKIGIFIISRFQILNIIKIENKIFINLFTAQYSFSCSFF